MKSPTFNDCFATSGARMTVAEALHRFSEKLAPTVGTEEVATRAAARRLLARDIVSARRIPPRDNAAVDGFAVFFDDLDPDAPTTLGIGGTVAAGHPLGRSAERGSAYKIFTGAQVPEGADTIFMVEDCEISGDTVTLPHGIKRGANLRLAGEDVQAGDVVMRRGMLLRPQEIGMAASLGLERLPVYRRLRAAVFSTGDEVREPGETLDDGSIYDINRYTLLSLLDGLGCAPTDLGIFKDEADLIRRGLADAAADHDVVITSGGVSMGEEDHIRGAVEDLGSLFFWNLAIKPGRPIALGCIPGGGGEVPFIGLPGNPVASMVTFMQIARPILLRLAGAENLAAASYRVPSAFDFKKKSGRREWLRVRLEAQADGTLAAVKFPEEGSGILTSMVQSDGLVVLDEACEAVRAGELVEFVPFNEVLR